MANRRVKSLAASGNCQALRTPGSRRARGFTLIELMIVVFIIGLSAGFATLAITPPEQSLLEENTEQFVTGARFVADEAMLTYEIISLFIEPTDSADGPHWCYRWRRFRDGNWMAVSDFLPDRCLHRDIDIELLVEGEPYEYDPDQTTPEPVLWFYPSGESTPFEIALFNRFETEEIERVNIDMMAGITWQETDDEVDQ